MRGILLSGIPELFLLALGFMIGEGERLISILAAALIHEMGHIITARLLRIRLRFCRTGMAGISLKYDFSTVSHLKEAAVSIAGPLAGITVTLICRLSGSLSYFAGASAALAIFNLLPISYLDGGGALSAILSSFLPPDTAWKICRILSVIFTLALWCSAVFIMLRSGGDLSVIAVSVYLLYRLFSE